MDITEKGSRECDESHENKMENNKIQTSRNKRDTNTRRGNQECGFQGLCVSVGVPLLTGLSKREARGSNNHANWTSNMV